MFGQIMKNFLGIWFYSILLIKKSTLDKFFLNLKGFIFINKYGFNITTIVEFNFKMHLHKLYI
jgi:hypothetical protein